MNQQPVDEGKDTENAVNPKEEEQVTYSNLAKNQKKKLKRKAKKANASNQANFDKNESSNVFCHQEEGKVAEKMEPNLKLNCKHEKYEVDFKQFFSQVIQYGDIAALMKISGNITIIYVDKIVAKVQLTSAHTIICLYTKFIMVSFNMAAFSFLVIEGVQVVLTYLAKTLENSFKERKDTLADIGMLFRQNLVTEHVYTNCYMILIG